MSFISDLFKGHSETALDQVEGLANKILGRPSAAEKREQANVINDQIQAYKNQTEITQRELQSKQAEQAAEKRRINEKQIRTLRNSYRPNISGFLNNQALGVGSGLNNKLGG
jgi:hypothetical protein